MLIIFLEMSHSAWKKAYRTTYWVKKSQAALIKCHIASVRILWLAAISYVSCHSLTRRGSYAMLGWEAWWNTGLWTGNSPPCLLGLFGVLSDYPGWVKQGWDESWEMLWGSRDTWKMKPIPENPEWVWSFLNTALQSSLCVPVVYLAVSAPPLQAVHLGALAHCIQILWSWKDPDDLGMCFGRCGHKWTKDIVLERKYWSKSHIA